MVSPAEHLFVGQEEALGATGTLKVIVSRAGACTASNSSPRLLTEVTSLNQRRGGGGEGEVERVSGPKHSLKASTTENSTQVQSSLSGVRVVSLRPYFIK